MSRKAYNETFWPVRLASSHRIHTIAAVVLIAGLVLGCDSVIGTAPLQNTTASRGVPGTMQALDPCFRGDSAAAVLAGMKPCPMP